MSDWADEKAHELTASILWSQIQRRTAIATALRQARADALEEAMEAAKRCYHAEIAALRSLKDKQP